MIKNTFLEVTRPQGFIDKVPVKSLVVYLPSKQSSKYNSLDKFSVTDNSDVQYSYKDFKIDLFPELIVDTPTEVYLNQVNVLGSRSNSSSFKIDSTHEGRLIVESYDSGLGEPLKGSLTGSNVNLLEKTITFDGSSAVYISNGNNSISLINSGNTSHFIEHGQPLKYSNGGGGSIDGLTNTTTYYALNELSRIAFYESSDGIDSNIITTLHNKPHGLKVGDLIQYYNNGGADIGPSNYQSYYVREVSSTDTFKLDTASSSAAYSASGVEGVGPISINSFVNDTDKTSITGGAINQLTCNNQQFAVAKVSGDVIAAIDSGTTVNNMGFIFLTTEINNLTSGDIVKISLSGARKVAATIITKINSIVNGSGGDAAGVIDIHDNSSVIRFSNLLVTSPTSAVGAGELVITNMQVLNVHYFYPTIKLGTNEESILTYGVNSSVVDINVGTGTSHTLKLVLADYSKVTNFNIAFSGISCGNDLSSTNIFRSFTDRVETLIRSCGLHRFGVNESYDINDVSSIFLPITDTTPPNIISYRKNFFLDGAFIKDASYSNAAAKITSNKIDILGEFIITGLSTEYVTLSHHNTVASFLPDNNDTLTFMYVNNSGGANISLQGSGNLVNGKIYGVNKHSDGGGKYQLFSYIGNDYKEDSPSAHLFSGTLSIDRGLSSVPDELLNNINFSGLNPTSDPGDPSGSELFNQGSYSNIATTTDGSGSGAEVNITVDSEGDLSGITVSTSGSGYVVGDVLNITENTLNAASIPQITLSGGTNLIFDLDSGSISSTVGALSTDADELLNNFNQMGLANDGGLFTEGGYTNIVTTSGSGSGAKLDLTINSDGNISSVTVSTVGIGYVVGGTISITESVLNSTGVGGSLSGGTNLIFDLDSGAISYTNTHKLIACHPFIECDRVTLFSTTLTEGGVPLISAGIYSDENYYIQNIGTKDAVYDDGTDSGIFKVPTKFNMTRNILYDKNNNYINYIFGTDNSDKRIRFRTLGKTSADTQLAGYLGMRESTGGSTPLDIFTANTSAPGIEFFRSFKLGDGVTFTSGASNFTVSSSSDVTYNQIISGNGIPSGTLVASVDPYTLKSVAEEAVAVGDVTAIDTTAASSGIYTFIERGTAYADDGFAIYTTPNPDDQYFILGVEEFDIKNMTNNQKIKDKFILPNNKTGGINESPDDFGFVNLSGKKYNYVSTLQPKAIRELNCTLTTADGSSSIFPSPFGKTETDGTLGYMNNVDFYKNDISMEFIFIPETIANDVVFD